MCVFLIGDLCPFFSDFSRSRDLFWSKKDRINIPLDRFVEFVSERIRIQNECPLSKFPTFSSECIFKRTGAKTKSHFQKFISNFNGIVGRLGNVKRVSRYASDFFLCQGPVIALWINFHLNYISAVFFLILLGFFNFFFDFEDTVTLCCKCESAVSIMVISHM